MTGNRRMSGKVFFDTNVLVYLYSSDEHEKRDKAVSLVENAGGIISTQVINELINVLHRKFNVEYGKIEMAVRELENVFHVSTVTQETIHRALVIGSGTGYSWFDSLIIASAIESGCDVLYSEDMRHNHTIDGTITIDNPFIVK